MLVFRAVILLSLLGFALCAVSSEDCDRLNANLPFSLFVFQDGSQLTRCTFNGQQCCSQQTLGIFDGLVRSAIEGSAFDFNGAFNGARTAINQLRSKTGAIIADITDDFIRPLLRSAVPSDEITTDFNVSIDATVLDIINSLNGSNVNLTGTLFDYFLAVSTVYFNEVLDRINSIPFVNLNLDIDQVQCGVRAVFNHIYTNTNATAELVELIQNISQAIRIIKQLPSQFERMLNNIESFRFSSTCVDVFLSNVLCINCHAQPQMCPGRCTEVFIGCVSPLSQSIAQLQTSFRLILSVVDSLIGSENRSTDSINVNRISELYDMMVESIQDIDFFSRDFARLLLNECGVSTRFLKRSTNEHHPIQHKRATLDIPDVSLNQTLFQNLEEFFILLRDDILLDGIAQFCSPDFRIEVRGISIPITAPNGMCSYGIGNVGTYDSSFTSTDIANQAFNNPAGRYDYEQLLGQAMNQTFIVTDLFENSDIPVSLFSTFLPNEPMPSTEFLSASPPTAPPTDPVVRTVSTDPTVSTNPTDPNSGGVGSSASATSFVCSCAVLACSMLALLL